MHDPHCNPNTRLNVRLNVWPNVRTNVWFNVRFNVRLNVRFNTWSDVLFNTWFNVWFNAWLTMRFNTRFNVRLKRIVDIGRLCLRDDPTQKRGLRDLAAKYLRLDVDKTYQRANFNVKPKLAKHLRQYAMGDAKNWLAINTKCEDYDIEANQAAQASGCASDTRCCGGTEEGPCRV